MCGICGVVGREDRGLVETMSTCQTHRGPESVGIHSTMGVTLGNQRLRVIDVEGGDQPIYNEDGDVVVVYNGEIYNFRELRSALDAAGHDFTTDTDTEVLVHGYEEWGPDLFGRLNGMFAIALFDETEERLLLARDRAGIKPLYYAYVDGVLLFASEPKAILRSPDIRPAVDGDALSYFLQLRYSPSHTTLFEGIETLLPGTYIDVRKADGEWTTDTTRFWSLQDAIDDPPDDPVTAVQNALRNAVDRQLVSDVPIGFYLSGGLDTSSVVALASEISDDPIHTFCMGFEDQQWDERKSARVVADHFDTVHHEISMDQTFLRDFPQMIWHADEPKRNLYPYYVAKEMAEHVTVALGGLGADELFGGYAYRYDRLADIESLRATEVDARALTQTVGERAVRTQLRRGALEDDGDLENATVLGHLDDDARVYVLLNSTDVVGNEAFYETRAFGDALPANSPGDRISETWPPNADTSLRERALGWDFQVKLSDDFLLVEDRMSMAHSLESRVPFLDNELVALAFSLPLSQKFDTESGGPTVGKRVLREAMRDKLPESVFQKDKQGFTMPAYRFAKDELLDYAADILNNPHIAREGYVQQSYLDALIDRPPQRDLTPHYKLLWKLVGLEIWYQMYILDGAEGPKQLDAYYT